MKSMHWMSILGLCFITIGGILSFFGTQLSDKKSQDELTLKIQEKNATIDNINKSNIKLIDQNSDLLNSNKDVSATNNELINQNKEMLTRVSQYQKEIEEKDIIIKKLEEKASLAERGIESKIHFNGSHRIRQGGMNSVTSNTEEYKMFEKMINLESQKKYPELIQICDESIKKFSKWYSPYYYKAVGLLNINLLGNKQKALELIDFVAINTKGDIDYAIPLVDLLFQLNEITRINSILESIPIEAIELIQDKDLKEKLTRLKK